MSKIFRGKSYNRNVAFYDSYIQPEGEVITVGAETIRVYQRDQSGNIWYCSGTTMPTNTTAGYAKGAAFIDTDGGVGSTFYINEGSATSCDFNVAAGEAGAGASLALDNLSAVQINTSLISDTDNTDDLGTNAKAWKDSYFEGVVYTDVIDEINAGVGVTVDSLLIKDGGIAGTGDITVNTSMFTVAGATGNTLVAGTFEATGASTLTGNVTMAGDLAVTGSFSFGGTLDVGDTLTVDELILDTDGVAPAGTNCYAVRDNAGDLTLNAITGKNIELAINSADEYSFDAAKLDMNANALDNCGYVILNAATAPANTEVYAVNDNTGDLTLNAVTAKEIHLAIAGTDVIDINGSELEVASGADIQFLGDDGILDSAGNEILLVEAVATATTYLNIKNANDAAIELECHGGVDKGFLFKNDQDEEILILTPTATAVNEVTIKSQATGVNPEICATGEADTGFTFMNDQSEEILILDSVATSVNEVTIRSAATGNKPIFASTGEADIGFEFHNDQAEEILILASAATSVNEVTITSTATGANPIISASGEANISLKLDGNGTGGIEFGSPVFHSSTETITAGTGGAISLVTSVSLLETDAGGDAYTLAAGTVGQIKFIAMITDGGGDATITLTGNPGTYDVITMGDVGDCAQVVYTATGWMPVSLQGCTIA